MTFLLVGRFFSFLFRDILGHHEKQPPIYRLYPTTNFSLVVQVLLQFEKGWGACTKANDRLF
jgi:hypothetical protein